MLSILRIFFAYCLFSSMNAPAKRKNCHSQISLFYLAKISKTPIKYGKVIWCYDKKFIPLCDFLSDLCEECRTFSFKLLSINEIINNNHYKAKWQH